ncbi:hypothetical protein BS78_06G160400 [Paspalum vaginatum]|nr:hypothetical protein BS78_06G160400 [Paspalum vaginatum]
MPQVKATHTQVSCQLQAAPASCPTSVKLRAREFCIHGHFPSPHRRISCSLDDRLGDRGPAKELEASENSNGPCAENPAQGDEEGESLGWSKDEVDAISALFDRSMRQKPLKPQNPTKLPVAPAPKQHIRLATRAVVRKNPEFLLGIAREIAALPPENDVSAVLDQWARFLQKDSLSLTIRELGHMGLPERALQTLCWAQRQKAMLLFPDDRVLASTIEVLARFGQLKVESALDQCVPTASRAVLEAMASGINNRMVHPSIYVKLMLEATRTPEGYGLASALVDQLCERSDLELHPQDCTTVMKVCIKLRRYAAVESLFSWFRESSRSPTVAGCLLDLPAYRVIVKLCVALHDPDRAVRYLSRLKEAGFVPTGDMYDNLIQGYVGDGRLAKCRQLMREAESAGVKLYRRLLSRLSERGRHS